MTDLKDVKERTIRKERYTGKQGEFYDELLVLSHHDPFYPDTTVKVHIDADSYDFQKKATIKTWEHQSDSWNLVSSIPYPKMKSFQYEYKFKDAVSKPALREFDTACTKMFGSGYEYHECAFKMDRDRLVTDAKMILFDAK